MVTNELKFSVWFSTQDGVAQDNEQSTDVISTTNLSNQRSGNSGMQHVSVSQIPQVDKGRETD